MEHLNKTQLDDPNVVGSGGKQTLKIADIFRTYYCRISWCFI